MDIYALFVALCNWIVSLGQGVPQLTVGTVPTAWGGWAITLMVVLVLSWFIWLFTKK